MNFDTMLNEYLDGTLTEAGEQMMFSAIAMNDDFRRDFTDSLRVRAAVQQEAASIVVPDEVTVSLFTSLGYMTFSEFTYTSGVLLSSLWRNVVGGLPSLFPYLVASCIGAAVMWFAMTNSNPTILQQDHSGSNTQQIATEPTPDVHTDVHTTVSSSATTASSANTTSHTKEHPHIHRQTQQTAFPTEMPMPPLAQSRSTNASFAETTPDEQSTSHASTPSLQDIPANALLSTNGTTLQQTSALNTKVPNAANTNASNTIAQIPLTPLPLVSDNKSSEVQAEEKRSPVEVSLRSLQLRPQTTPHVASNDNTGINNIAVGLYYRLNENWLTGVEAGREPFVQQYSREDALVIQNIQQYPALWWGGLAVRFEGHSLLGKSPLFPLAQCTAGLAETGFYTRTSAGLGWDIAPSVTLTAGAEWAMLMYAASGTTHTTNNLGWMYGFTIRF